MQELKPFDPSIGKVLEQTNKEAIRGLEKSLDKVDEQILTFINDDQELKQKCSTCSELSPVTKLHCET